MMKTLENYIKEFNDLLNFSDICWWIIDYKNQPGFYYCNELMEDIFLLNKEEKKHSIEQTCPIAGDYIKNVELASSKKAKLIINEYLELINNQRDEYNNTFPYYDKKSNSIKYFSSRAKVLKRDKEGKVELLYGILEDITNKTIQAKELKEHNSIIDKHIMTSTTDTKGYITNISTAFCNITGYTKDELLGQKHSLLKHPDTPGEIYKDMWGSLTSGKTWSGELKNLKRDGSVYWIKLIISPNFDSQGKIKGYTTINQDITDKKIIEKLSTKDKLTDIYNRAKLDSLMENEFFRSKRYETPFALIILDIDFFKSINDKFGHLAGDKVLINIAKTLKENTRKTDFVGRWGGEEFLVICANTSVTQAQMLARKLKNSFYDLDHGINQKISASFGISVYLSGDKDVETILQRADNALYKAKENGRNRIEISY